MLALAILPFAVITSRGNLGRTAIFQSTRARTCNGSPDCHGCRLCRDRRRAAHIRHMKKSDIICPNCSAGYRRVELASGEETTGEFRCLLCDHVLEVFDGTAEVAIRLTVQPEKTFQGIDH